MGASADDLGTNMLNHAWTRLSGVRTYYDEEHDEPDRRKHQSGYDSRMCGPPAEDDRSESMDGNGLDTQFLASEYASRTPCSLPKC